MNQRRRQSILVFALLLLPSTAIAQKTADEQFACNQEEVQKDPKKEGGEKKAGDPVVLSTGRFFLQETDLTIRCRGMDLTIQRTYQNGAGTRNALSRNWDMNWFKKIVVQYVPNSSNPPLPCFGLNAQLAGIYYFDGSTRVERLQFDSSNPGLLRLPNGYFAKVRYEDTGQPGFTPDRFFLRQSDGTTYTFDEKTNSSRFVGGCALSFFLSKVEDRMGNEIRLSYEVDSTYGKRLDTITDPHGRVIDVQYDPSGRLSAIEDFEGRRVEYSYLLGNLHEVRSPIVLGTSTGNDFPNGKTRRYLYGDPGTPTEHNIVGIADPQSILEDPANPIPYLQNEYDGSGRRVLSQTVGGINASGVPAGGTYRFYYATSTVFHSWFTEAGKTAVVTPNGNVTLHVFEPNGNDILTYEYTGRLNPDYESFTPPQISTLFDFDLSSRANAQNPSANRIKLGLPTDLYTPPLRSGDPESYVTLKRMDENGRVVELEGPGSHELFTYDSGSPDPFQRGNLLRIERRPKPDDGSTPLVETFSFEPIYNQLRVSTDPRGNDPSYVPRNEGTTSLGRYMKTSVFDYLETDLQTGPLSALVNTWKIDLQQGSAYAAVPGLEADLPRILDSDDQPDLNGDGVTDQTFGNTILRRSPPARALDGTDPVSMVGLSPVFVDQIVETKISYNSFSLPAALEDPEGNVTTFAYYSETDPTGTTDPSIASELGGFPATTQYPENVLLVHQYDPLGHPSTLTDGRGHTTTYEYNQLDQLVAVIDALGYVTSMVFDGNDNLTEKWTTNIRDGVDPLTGLPTGTPTDRGTIVHRFKHDLLNNLVESDLQAGSPEDPSARIVTRFRFDRDGNEVLILHPEFPTDPSNVTSSIYDERGLLWTETRGGLTTEFRSFPAHSDLMGDPEIAGIPVTPPPPGEMVTTFKTYDNHGNLILKIDGEGQVWLSQYDGFNRAIRHYDPLFNYTETKWDVASRTLETATFEFVDGVSDRVLERSIYSHDEHFRVFQVDREFFSYDLGTPLVDGRLTPGDGFISSRFAFDRKGRVRSAMDDNGCYVGKEYDGLDRLIAEWDNSSSGSGPAAWTDPGSYRNEFIYDANGNGIQSKAFEHRSDGTAAVFDRWFFFDALNRKTAEMDNLGHTHRFLYDSRGNLIFESDARTADVAFSHFLGFDSASDHLAFSNPPPHQSSNFSATNGHGNTSHYEYDDADRKISVSRFVRTSGSGESPVDTTSFGDGVVRLELRYDSNSRITAQIDEGGNTTQYEYDSLDRPSRTVFADGTAHDYLSYTRNHRVALERDANGNEITCAYDEAMRLIRRTIQRGSGVVGSTQEDFDYDGLDRMTLASDDDSTVALGYDSLSNVVHEVQNGQIVTSISDGVGNRIQGLYPSGFQLQRNHDPLNRLESLVDGATGVILAKYEYEGKHRVSRKDLILLGNGFKMTSTRSFDEVRRVIATHHRKTSGQTIDYRTYAWDRSHNKTRRRDETSGVAHDYEYDSLDRMVRSQRTGSPMDRIVTYDLDGVGNRNLVSGGLSDGLYSLHPADTPVNQYTFVPGVKRQYDARGNWIQSYEVLGTGGGPIGGGPFDANPISVDPLETIAYDYRNQMTRHEDHDTGAIGTYRYDALGRRISKIVGGEETRYFYLGAHVCEEQDSSGGLRATYVSGPGVDDHVVAIRNSGYQVYHGDDQGNVMKVTNLFGGLLESYDYEDYGSPLDSGSFQPKPDGSSIGNPFLFNGRRFDPETGLYYFRNRYLDPSIGRFTTRDPLGIWGDGANLGNGYSFVGNNPWTYVDPLGLATTAPSTAHCPGMPQAPGALDWFWDEFNRDPKTANRNPNETGGLQKKRKEGLAERRERRAKMTRLERLREDIGKIEKKIESLKERNRVKKMAKHAYRGRLREYGQSIRNKLKEIGGVLAQSLSEQVAKNGLTPTSLAAWKTDNAVSDLEFGYVKTTLRHANQQAQEQWWNHDRKAQEQWNGFLDGVVNVGAFFSGLGGGLIELGFGAAGSDNVEALKRHSPRSYQAGRIPGYAVDAFVGGKLLGGANKLLGGAKAGL